MHPNVKDLTGQTFGLLTVERLDKPPHGHKRPGAHWQCKCECGAYVVARADKLNDGRIKSCGCGARNRAKPTVSAHSSQEWAKYTHNTHTHMSETTTPISRTLEELKSLRAQFDLLDPKLMLKGTRVAVRTLDGMIDQESRRLHPEAYERATPGTPGEEWREPRTVKGETLSEQTRRIAGYQPEATGNVAPPPGPRLALKSLPASIGNPAAGEALDANAAMQAADPRNWSHPAIGPNPTVFDGIGVKPVRKHSHYFKDVSRLTEIDVYRVLELFDVTNPSIAHAAKKLLVAGGRGAGKDIRQDIKEAIDSLTRWQEMRREDERAA